MEKDADVVEAVTVTLLEERVAALERELAELKRVVGQAAPDGGRWWETTFGRFRDDPTFEEAVRLGREWRERQPKC